MSEPETLLYKLDPQSRFGDRAIDYAKYRPSYPPEAINQILTGLKDSASLVAADIGAGTGISSRLLADRGVKVIALEPNKAMSQAATPHPGVEFREGTAENTGLPDASLDLVTCFQAFHWFDPQPTLAEFRRILKPQGRVAIVWNNRDTEGNDEFTRQHGELIALAANDHPVHSRFRQDQPTVNFPFLEVHQYTFTHRQALSKNALIGLALSSSYLPKTGTVYKRLIADLTNLYNHYCDEAGLVYLQYKTSVFLSEI